ncbi:MAG TPA: DUF899 family protein [Streptosporangiaceae bacterium]|nr:DUF899 family protein [Streptosporangiaceae bacterium]
MSATALPPVVDAGTWQRQLDALRAREKAATRELDAIAAQRRRLPMVKVPDYTLEGEQGPVRLADVKRGVPPSGSCRLGMAEERVSPADRSTQISRPWRNRLSRGQDELARWPCCVRVGLA